MTATPHDSPELSDEASSPRRLGPWSPYSVDDLVRRAPAIARAWSEADVRGPDETLPDALSDEVTWTLVGLGRWLDGTEPEVPEDLRHIFRDLALAFRNQHMELEDTLDALEVLEELLVGADRQGETGSPSVSTRLRRAMRSLWTEVIQLNQALLRRRDRERIQALESFEEVLSHELGNRLGAARTGVDILQEAPDSLSAKRREDLLELVREGIDAALQTVKDVDTFVQAQSWVEDQPRPLREVVLGVVKGLAAEARSKEVALEIDVDEIPETPVDAGRVRLILSNFLVNGIRYRDAAKERSWVRLTGARDGGEVRLEVSDNGIGIPREERAEIFQFHRRGRNHHDREGSGLGLTIAAEAVTQLGGDVSVESEVGVGTTFRVVIPVSPDVEQARRGSAGAVEASG